MKNVLCISFVSMLALAGCEGPLLAVPATTTTLMGADAAVIFATRPAKLPPADTDSQIPEHESWCYATLGEPVCYTQAQNTAPGRLINVDPQNRYPITNRDYDDELAGKRRPVTGKPVELGVAAPDQPALDEPKGGFFSFIGL